MLPGKGKEAFARHCLSDCVIGGANGLGLAETDSCQHHPKSSRRSSFIRGVMATELRVPLCQALLWLNFKFFTMAETLLQL
eukprot:scaffold116_cov334-Pavlova_lutheri.AAC.56